jgi:hypothetical protein
MGQEVRMRLDLLAYEELSNELTQALADIRAARAMPTGSRARAEAVRRTCVRFRELCSEHDRRMVTACTP